MRVRTITGNNTYAIIKTGAREIHILLPNGKQSIEADLEAAAVEQDRKANRARTMAIILRMAIQTVRADATHRVAIFLPGDTAPSYTNVTDKS